MITDKEIERAAEHYWEQIPADRNIIDFIIGAQWSRCYINNQNCLNCGIRKSCNNYNDIFEKDLEHIVKCNNWEPKEKQK